MSSRQLCQFETDLLAKGLNFSIKFKILPSKDIKTSTIDAVKDLEKKILIRLVSWYLSWDDLSKIELESLKKLQCDKLFLILTADKGRSFCNP